MRFRSSLESTLDFPDRLTLKETVTEGPLEWPNYTTSLHKLYRLKNRWLNFPENFNLQFQSGQEVSPGQRVWDEKWDKWTTSIGHLVIGIPVLSLVPRTGHDVQPRGMGLSPLRTPPTRRRRDKCVPLLQSLRKSSDPPVRPHNGLQPAPGSYPEREGLFSCLSGLVSQEKIVNLWCCYCIKKEGTWTLFLTMFLKSIMHRKIQGHFRSEWPPKEVRYPSKTQKTNVELVLSIWLLAYITTHLLE